jgi:hypothetical protein
MVDTNIGKIGSAIEASRSAATKLDFGPTPNMRIALTDFDVSDRALASLVWDGTGVGFVWGIHTWGTKNNKVVK